MIHASVSQSALFRLSTRICSALICALGISANANNIMVTNTNDSGPGSLRQALADAFDGDTINFHVPASRHTITLTNGGLGSIRESRFQVLVRTNSQSMATERDAYSGSLSIIPSRFPD